MARQLHPPVPSGPADVSHQVSCTCTPSGFLDDLEPDLPLQKVVLHLPVPTFALCDLGNVAGALDCEDRDRGVTEYFSFLHVPGSQVSHFLPERKFSLSSFYHQCTYRSFSCCSWCLWLDWIVSYHIYMFGCCFYPCQPSNSCLCLLCRLEPICHLFCV